MRGSRIHWSRLFVWENWFDKKTKKHDYPNVFMQKIKFSEGKKVLNEEINRFSSSYSVLFLSRKL